MENIAGFPFLPLELTKRGEADALQETGLIEALQGELSTTTDLVVLSHGWNNNMAEALALYTTLLRNLRRRLDARGAAAGGRQLAVLGIYWPSKKFGEASLRPDADPEGGAAGFEGSDLPKDMLRAQLNQLGELLGLGDDPKLAEAKAAADEIDGGVPAEQRFVEALRALLPRPEDGADDASELLFDGDGDLLLEQFEAPVMIIAEDEGEGGAAVADAGAVAPIDAEGAAADLGSLFAGTRAAAGRLLNYTTYYVMKERAGHVGRGLNATLAKVRAARPQLRLHLVGHSFGARVVTAAVDGPAALRPSSLSLLQGAFSHNGFAADVDGRPGFFRKVLAEAKVEGPILITHTKNDMAVGVAYALASRLAGDNRAALGGPEDKFGGIGRNGAIRLGQNEHRMAELGDDGFDYGALARGVVVNLKADAFVKGHGDVANPAVANAVLSAVLQA